jgi:5-methylcytosine-specific restriction endonuclease McrA
MANQSYSEKLKDPRWQKKRLEILERDGWACRFCGCKEKTLHAHHTIYLKPDPWDYPDKVIITLCDDCHEAEHEWWDSVEEQLLNHAFRILFTLEERKKLLSHFPNDSPFIQSLKNLING